MYAEIFVFVLTPHFSPSLSHGLSQFAIGQLSQETGLDVELMCLSLMRH